MDVLVHASEKTASPQCMDEDVNAPYSITRIGGARDGMRIGMHLPL